MRTEKQTTRKNLVQAAMPIFANKGYKGANVREICCAAQANLAAVNYHFGGKLGLYKTVLTQAFENAGPGRPMPTLSENPCEPEQQLKKWIYWFTERLLREGKGQTFSQLMIWELREPTSVFTEFIAQSMVPVHEKVEEMICAITGLSVEHPKIRMCCLSIFGQCLYYKMAHPMIHVLYNSSHYTDQDICDIAQHIFDFSIQGIQNCL